MIFYRLLYAAFAFFLAFMSVVLLSVVGELCEECGSCYKLVCAASQFSDLLMGLLGESLGGSFDIGDSLVSLLNLVPQRPLSLL